MSAQEPIIQLLGLYLAFVYGVIYRQYRDPFNIPAYAYLIACTDALVHLQWF